MGERRSRYVLLCQHLLTIGAVLVMLAPSARIVTLDIVAPPYGKAAAAHSHR